MTDTEMLAASSQAVAIEAQIRALEAECAIFKKDSRVPYNEDTQTYLDANEAARAIQKGHRIVWAVHPRLDKSDVEYAWASMQAELDTLRGQRDALLQVGETNDEN
jgi:hypothetical protein